MKPQGKAVRRDRVLADQEIKILYEALPEAKIQQITRDVIKLLFLTGQRSGEVCGMVRSEIDFDKALWTIPSSRTKNSLAHEVPLSAASMLIIAQYLRSSDLEKGAPLFARTGASIASNAIGSATRKKLQVLDDRWTPHDIRRTVATGMANIGVQPHIIEATLNHISGFKSGVAGVYNRSQYGPEKRQALNIWAAHLESVLLDENSNVVLLDQRQ